ncbi:Oxysterol-binding protein 1 [Galdieria sulphuraria]|nr:Oxysterol-binding protein 1 [Galdieria sulphuraria]
MIEIFSQEDIQNGTKGANENGQSIITATQGFSDLISWGIYVLETTCDTGTDQYLHKPTIRQSSTQFTVPSSLDPPFDEDLDDKETELEFFDAETDERNIELDATTDNDSYDERLTLSLKNSNSPSRQKTANRRTKLPVHRGDVKRPSLWSVLKDAVGKDVSRISIPVTFNEPLSFLQRMAEDIEYSELLDRASETEDPFQRLLFVSVLAVSHYCSAQQRIAKPFNPLLGETFELWLPEKNNLKFMSEQVSHHPPISASFATAGTEEKISWTYSAVHMVANKFWGKSIEVFPTGPVQVTIPRFGDYITYEKATTCVHNILIGRVWIDNYGEMVLKNHTTGDYAIIKLRKTGWLSDMKNFGEVRGIIYDRSGNVQKRMSGTWHDSLYEDLSNGKRQLLWRASKRPPPEDSGGYHFTSYAVFLNQLTPELEAHIAPTDSRFRPDQRALENAQYKLASDEKFRLEEKQRAARKKREMNGESYYPSWFEQKWNHYLQKNEWTFNHQYWHHRESHDWSKCPDIF